MEKKGTQRKRNKANDMGGEGNRERGRVEERGTERGEGVT